MSANRERIREALTFDDVLLVPCRSEFLPSDVELKTRFSRNVPISVPVASAAMDTVTEWKLAVALAREGGIGVIHRNLPIADQIREVDKVKRSANGVIQDPVTLQPEATMREAREIMSHHNISGLPIVEGESVVGILTRRDCRFQTSDDTPVAQVMTADGLVTAPPGTSLEDARELLFRHKVEKLLICEDGKLRGLITMKDLDMLEAYPNSATDSRGRLRVAAAVGVHDDERAAGLVEAGADVLVVDTAHGHSQNVLDSVRSLKTTHPEVDVVAGNVATSEAALELVEAGADGVKVGIGPGSICTTRVVAGVGVPQFTAVHDIAQALEGKDVPVISDGGVRFSGDIAKALAAGASSVMIGSLFAGVDESPGETILYKGRTFKAVRGMGSLGAMVEGSKERYRQGDVQDHRKLVPEGIEGMVPSKGKLSEFVYQLCGGVRASMGYCGAGTIPSFWKTAVFCRVTAAGQRESHPHDVTITKESPNYFQE